MLRTDAMKIIENSEFRKFGEFDWEVFSFVKTSDPLVCDSEKCCVVIDGSRAVILWMEWSQEFLLTQEDVARLRRQPAA